MSKMLGDGVRFLFAGLTNFAFSLTLFQLLLFIAPANIAYTITWLIGIIFVSIVYPKTVFKGAKKTKKNFFLSSLIYVISFFIGYTIIVLLEFNYPGNRFSIFIALLFTACINFMSMRKMLVD
jgi:hypothetical protein